ncbi:ABC transporter permease [Hwanghaeella sp.]|uniref:ABC transporter permease n=1 Tax=Hwanghaeella sp. TaxID=2605943 RepID=UPI003CCB7556
MMLLAEASREDTSRRRTAPKITLAARRISGLNTLGVATLIWRQVVAEFLAFKLVLLGPALQALLFALVISLAVGSRIAEIGGLPFLEFLAPGLVIAAAVQRSFESTAFSMVHEKLEGTIADVFGAPLNAGEILTGYTIGAMVTGICIGLPVWLVLLPFGAGLPVHVAVMVYFLLTGCVILALFGLIAGMQSHRWDSLAAKETFVLAPLLFLSGSFFTIDALDEPFRTMMMANPVFHLVNGFRYAMTGYADAPVWVSVTVVGGLAAILCVVALRLVAVGYKVKA